jgi:hypothetical protein
LGLLGLGILPMFFGPKDMPLLILCFVFFREVLRCRILHVPMLMCDLMAPARNMSRKNRTIATLSRSVQICGFSKVDCINSCFRKMVRKYDQERRWDVLIRIVGVRH